MTASKARRTYSRHGLNRLKARVKVRGLDAIDRRTAAARALLSSRQSLLSCLGGSDNLSEQEILVVDEVTRLLLYKNHVDAWLMQQSSLINKKKRSLLPIVKERHVISDAILRHLQALGLERRKKNVDLDEILQVDASDSSRADDRDTQPLPASSQGFTSSGAGAGGASASGGDQ